MSNPTFIGFIALPETPRRYHADECSARSRNRKCLGECESAIVCSVNNLKRSFNIHISCFDTQKTYHHDCWSLKNLFYPVSLLWVRPGCLHINNLNCLRNMERKIFFSNHPIWNLLRPSFQDGPFSNLNCSQKKNSTKYTRTVEFGIDSSRSLYLLMPLIMARSNFQWMIISFLFLLWHWLFFSSGGTIVKF